MDQQFKRIITKRTVIGLWLMALIAFLMQGCATPERDHYVALTHNFIEEGAPKHDEVALVFGLPFYKQLNVESKSILVEVSTSEQP